MSAARHAAAGLVALISAAGYAVAAWTLAPHLGAEMATHWGAGSARPDGFSATWGGLFWGTATATAVLTVVALVAVIVSAFHGRRSARLVAAVACGASAITASMWVTSAWATADAATPADATLGARMVLQVGAPVVGIAVYALLPASADATAPAPRRPYLPLAHGERAAWSTVITSRLLGAIAVGAAVLALFFIVMAATSPAAGMVTPAVIVTVITLATVALTPVRLTVDRRGIRLVSVLLRIPIIRIRLGDIRDVAVETVRASEWGGWGYRFSGAGLAYVTRSGPGIVITRRTGSRVAITVDGPDGAAGVANGLLRRGETDGRA